MFVAVLFVALSLTALLALWFFLFLDDGLTDWERMLREKRDYSDRGVPMAITLPADAPELPLK